MKRLISRRKQYKAFSRGDMKFVHSENSKILAFTRTYEEETMLVVVNLSRYTQPVELELAHFYGYTPVEVFSKNKFPSIQKDGTYFTTLGGHDCQWFVLEKQTALLHNTNTLPRMELTQWEDILQRDSVLRLENIVLPQYLSKLRWFGGKGRVIESMSIIRSTSIPLPENSALFLLIEVAYQSGLPDIYFLPVAFGKENLALKLKDHCPKAVICNMRVNGEDGILYDALYGIELQEYLIKQLGSDQKVSLVEGDIVFHGNDYLKQYLERKENIKPKVLSGEQSNTSITYGNKFFLKMYRKVDRAMNPDLELSQFLSQQGKFKSIPPFVGSIEWFYDRGSMVLGLAQEMVENSGDAWTYMLERLDNFNDRILEQPPGTTGPPPKVGSFIDPIGYESMPEQMQELLDAGIAEKARQLGIRTGEMHKALAAGQSIDFKPEEYSLHYQRSLFAGLQS
jgi:maltose alpha-D-glucosyltransferase / alpha-amylase